MASRITRVRELISRQFQISHLDIINESHMHNVPKGAETHLKVVVVTPDFQGLSRVKREQSIQGLLKPEMETGLHALSIIAKTPSEWETANAPPDASPACRGGFGK